MLLYAGVVELVDSEDLGSSAKWCVGSSPTTRTIVDFTILSMLEWKGSIQIAQIGLAKRRDR